MSSEILFRLIVLWLIIQRRIIRDSLVVWIFSGQPFNKKQTFLIWGQLFIKVQCFKRKVIFYISNLWLFSSSFKFYGGVQWKLLEREKLPTEKHCTSYVVEPRLNLLSPRRFGNFRYTIRKSLHILVIAFKDEIDPWTYWLRISTRPTIFLEQEQADYLPLLLPILSTMKACETVLTWTKFNLKP